MNEFFTVERDARGITGLVHLQLCQPARLNTLSLPFFPALRDLLRSLHDEGRTRVLVISSTGKHFSAGMALDTFAGDSPALDTSNARARLSFQDMLGRLMDCFTALDEARFPVLCAVQGGCIGGALDLAAACDMRYASADAFFCVQEINIGMAADLGVLQRLQRLLPQGLARELAYTGERLGAERALSLGLVNAVLPDAAALLEHVMQVAKQIATRSPLAIATSKLALNHARDHGTAASLAQMKLLQSAVFDTAEMARAISGWQQKKDADFDPLNPVPSL